LLTRSFLFSKNIVSQPFFWELDSIFIFLPEAKNGAPLPRHFTSLVAA